MKIIDSHLHIWATPKEAITYPYFQSQEPPPSLSTQASADALLESMSLANVQGSLIVQPINHKFDHSYVTAAIKAHPDKFKGMMLHDPSLPLKDALVTLEELSSLGFVGVRFNPYLWPEGETMSNAVGLEVFKRCGELNMPVGIMCFKGLDLHWKELHELITFAPKTIVIIDHFGFTQIGTEKGDSNFKELLAMAHHSPNVVVKLSAVFRVASLSGTYPYEDVKTHRFLPLLEAFGADRLLFGTDFPFVLETEQGYKGAVDIVNNWVESKEDKAMIMGGTAERLFGSWESTTGTIDA